MDKRETNSLPLKQLLSTGEAAELCSVTPDTVLKWIRAGKIPATRTPGGHHRISRSALIPLIKKKEAGGAVSDGSSPFQYCWEFYSDLGTTPEGCKQCVVYRSRTLRCYEMSSLPADAGYVGLFCEGDCEECEYHRMVSGQAPNVLVITDRSRLKESLERDSKNIDFNLRITDCEYRCSMVIERYRPDYVVIDCSMGTGRSGEIAKLLTEDPRIPFVRIIFAGDPKELPRGCDKIVFALINRHFTAMMLSDLISGTRSQLSGAS
jgi:excisionase family DNA binding protein